MDSSNKHKRQRNLKAFIQKVILVVSLVYIICLLWYKRDHIQTLLANIRLHYILIIMTVQILFLILQAWRYQIIIKKCSGAKIPYKPWLKLFILGRFLNRFVPQLGNLFRSIKLKQDYRISYTDYISSFLAFAWLDTVFNLILALIVTLITASEFKVGSFDAKYLLFVILAFVLAVPIVLNLLLKNINFKAKSIKWIHSKISEVFEVNINNLKDISFLLKTMALGLLVFISICVILNTCFIGLNIRTQIAAIVLFCALHKLGLFITITPGNFGVQEIVYGVLAELMNIGMEQGVLVSVIIRITGTIVVSTWGILCGGVELIKNRRNYISQGNTTVASDAPAPPGQSSSA